MKITLEKKKLLGFRIAGDAKTGSKLGGKVGGVKRAD